MKRFRFNKKLLDRIARVFLEETGMFLKISAIVKQNSSKLVTITFFSFSKDANSIDFLGQQHVSHIG